MSETAAVPVFDFEGAGTWDAGDSILGIGDYVVEIISAGNGASSSGLPQIELEVSCLEGNRRDWITYGSPNDTKGIGVKKVNTLFVRAGVQLLNTDVEMVDGKLRVAEAKVAQLVGKKVGILVRKEKPEDEYPRITAYVPVELVSGATAGVGTGGGATPSDGGADIPFANDGFPTFEERRVHHSRW